LKLIGVFEDINQAVFLIFGMNSHPFSFVFDF
jgi:hypothetical protein